MKDPDKDKFRAAIEKQWSLAEEVSRLSAQIDQYELSVANALWIERSYPLRLEFVDTISKGGR